MEVFRRRIVGWAVAAHLRTGLMLDALNMALGAEIVMIKNSQAISSRRCSG
jgi:transposase InsO family protein